VKILVDIGHPAHIHYFKHAIKILQSKGHDFLITTRDKEIALDLLKSYGFNYICTGKNKAGLVNKIYAMVENNRVIYRAAKKFKPDLFFSFYSPFAAQVGWWMKTPVIGFADTEFAKLSIKLTRPFTTYSFTPECFSTDLGKNHFRFKGYMETFYLHPSHFTPDESIIREIGLSASERFFIMRFVSFGAGHDVGETGIDEGSKIAIAEYLANQGKLLISSEGPLPSKLEKYRLKAKPENFHHILAFASLYVGEGITTASECAHLGTPAILVNSLSTGYIHEEANKHLIYYYKTPDKVIDRIKDLLNNNSLKENFLARKNDFLAGVIDCTAYLVELLDKFPQSMPPYETSKSLQDRNTRSGQLKQLNHQNQT
jgi:uncharacterized protein